jgi:hypothetical protein
MTATELREYAYILRTTAQRHPHLGAVPLATAYACRVMASSKDETR